MPPASRFEAFATSVVDVAVIINGVGLTLG